MTSVRVNRRPMRLAVRLTGAVLVPMAVIGYGLHASAAGRSTALTQSRAIEGGTAELVDVVALGLAVGRERIPATVALADIQNRSTSQVSEAIGLDLEEVGREDRAATDAALAELAADPWAAGIRARIEPSRKAATDPSSPVGNQEALQQLREAQNLIDDRVLSRIEAMQQRIDAVAAGTAAVTPLRRDLDSLREAYDFLVAFADQALAGFAMAGVDIPVEARVNGTHTDIASPRVAFVLANSTYRSLGEQLGSTSSGAIRERFDTLRDSVQTGLIASYFDDLAQEQGSREADLRASPTTFADAALLVRTFLSVGLQQLDALKDLLDVAGDQVIGDARAIRVEADQARQRIWLGSLVALALALLVVAVLSWTVTRPLVQVAARARRIAAGDLDSAAVTGGPREVVDVSHAFDEMAQNLQLLRVQADALAAGETDHDSLGRTVPGSLGQALQASVGRLSQSLEARRQLEDQLRHESTHDPLTGLLNRASALVSLEQALSRSNRVGGGLGVVQIDLDRLGAINDIAGTGTGDEVLRRVATVLAATVRSGDVVARLDSDEFVIISETRSIDVLMELAGRVLAALAEVVLPDLPPEHAQRLRDAGLSSGVGASIGVVAAFNGLQDATALLRDAAGAVRAAKRRGPGHVELLDEELRRGVERRHQVHDHLRRALEASHLQLRYQPIVDRFDRTVGVESLARWTSAELGSVPPDEFVAAAESSDLVLDLDRWVLAEALRQLTAWDDAGDLPGIYISVNISGRHLGGRCLVHDVSTALATSGIAPERLLLEITETVLLSDLTSAAAELSELRALGVRVAVDDFGTGYTSIAHLQQLPVDVLKIDRSFVVGMTEERGRALVRTMIDMAAALGLTVVAEGVEVPEELETLRALGCPLIQGFYTGRPAEPGTVVGRRTPRNDPR